MRQLRVIKLVNFQSWSDKSDDMTFAPDVLNVIKGRNETGKSVVFKVLYEMCFPGYHGAQYLVRRGCAEGYALFVYTDGTQVLFQLSIQGNRVFHLQLPESSEIQSWQQYEIPEEVVSAMGLLISKENQIILNVLDKDVPLPFIKSDPKYNASVLKSKLEPEELTRFFERSKDYIRRIQGARSHFSNEAKIYDARQMSLDFVDVESLRATRIFLDNHAAALNKYIDAYNALADYDAILEVKPEVKLYPLAEVKELLDVVELLSNTQDALSEVDRLNQCAPASPRFSEDQLDAIHTQLNALGILNSCRSASLEFVALERPVVQELPNVSAELDVCRILEVIQSELHGVLQLEAPEVVYLDSKLPTLFEALHESQEAFKNLGVVYQNLVGAVTSKQKMDSISSDISQMEKELGICPTCGRAFHE